MGDAVYPVILEPIVMEKPWGEPGYGPKLVSGADPLLKVGEVWLTADGDFQSRVLNGPRTGDTLAMLRSGWGERFLGRRFRSRTKAPFPLLLKLLRAREYLSVQVHPDDADAERLEGAGPGKTEAWYVLEPAGPSTGPKSDNMILGLKPGLDRADLARALETGRLEDILNRVRVEAGEVHFIHPGRLHSIGPGVTLFEIQQNADLTYRFYDWNRVDVRGRPRALHIDRALEVVDTESGPWTVFFGLPVRREPADAVLLAAGSHFALERWKLKGAWRGSLSGERFEVLTPISGSARLLSSGPADELELRPGRAVVLPADLGGYEIDAPSGVTILRSWVPDLAAEVAAPLRDQGWSREDIEALAGVRRPNDLSDLIPA